MLLQLQQEKEKARQEQEMNNIKQAHDNMGYESNEIKHNPNSNLKMVPTVDSTPAKIVEKEGTFL